MALRVSSIPALVELVEVLRRLRARPQNVDVPQFVNAGNIKLSVAVTNPLLAADPLFFQVISLYAAYSVPQMGPPNTSTAACL